MNVAVVGAGSIGATVARKLSAAGHQVSVANSRGPETLADFAAEIGATAADAASAVQRAETVIVSVPLGRLSALRRILAPLPDGVAVLDTSNYYPSRDGHIRELDAGATEARWASEQLGRPVTKAWNAVLYGSFAEKGRALGEPGRIALPVAGDDPAAKEIAVRLVEATGFDAYDAGALEESWRFQPGNPAFCADLDLAQLRLALAQADRVRAPRRRDLGIEGIEAFGEHTNDDVLHLYRALTKSPGRTAG